MWEKISGLISIVVVVFGSRGTAICAFCNGLKCVFVHLTVRGKVIVAALYPTCGAATSSASFHCQNKCFIGFSYFSYFLLPIFWNSVKYMCRLKCKVSC